MTDQAWVTSSSFDIKSLVFSDPQPIEQNRAYKRYNVKYRYPGRESPGNLYITTPSVDDLIECLGIREDVGIFAKQDNPNHQATFVLKGTDVNHCALFDIIGKIGDKFAEYIKTKTGKLLEIKYPIKKIEESDVARLYCGLIESNSGTVHSRFYDKTQELTIKDLNRKCITRPSLYISFVVKDKINMKIQVSQMFVSEISTPNYNLANDN